MNSRALASLTVLMCGLIVSRSNGQESASPSDADVHPIWTKVGGSILVFNVLPVRNGTGRLARRGAIDNPANVPDGPVPITEWKGWDAAGREAVKTKVLNAAGAAQPKAQLEKDFIELPAAPNLWYVYERADGRLDCRPPNGTSHVFVLDSLDQFDKILPGRTLDAQDKELERSAGEGGQKLPDVELRDKVSLHLQDVLKGQSEIVVTSQDANRADECLFVRAQSGDVPPRILWLPCDSGQATPKRAFEAFAIDQEETRKLAQVPPDAYERMRSRAWFPSDPAKVLPRKIPVYKNTVAVSTAFGWKAKRLNRAHVILSWPRQNSYQDAFLKDTATAVDDGPPRNDKFGLMQVVAAPGRLVLTPSTELRALVKHYYPTSFEANFNNARFTFRLVEGNGIAPLYLMEEETTIRQWVALLRPRDEDTDPPTFAFETADQRKKYAENKDSAPPRAAGQLRTLVDAESEQSADRNTYAQFAFWLLGQCKERGDAHLPSDKLFQFEDIRLLAHFARRESQWQETEGKAHDLNSLSGAARNKLAILTAADLALVGLHLDDLRDWSDYRSRGVLHDDSGNGIAYPSVLVNPLDEPVTLVSPTMVQKGLKASKNFVQFRLPCAAEWRAAATPQWAARVQKSWTGNRNRPWPKNALNQIGRAEGQDQFWNLAGNVSEIVVLPKRESRADEILPSATGGDMFGIMGGNFRTFAPAGDSAWPASPNRCLLIGQDASSPAIGFRLVMMLRDGDSVAPAVPVDDDNKVLASDWTTSEADETDPTVRTLFTRLWGKDWKAERTRVARAFGSHDFWFAEHLRNVLAGMTGYRDRDDGGSLFDDLETAKFLARSDQRLQALSRCYSLRDSLDECRQRLGRKWDENPNHIPRPPAWPQKDVGIVKCLTFDEEFLEELVKQFNAFAGQQIIKPQARLGEDRGQLRRVRDVEEKVKKLTEELDKQ